MQILKEVYKKAKKKPCVIVFPEGEDKRIIKASKIISKEKLALPYLLKKGSLESRLNDAVKLLNEKEADAIICGCIVGTKDIARTAFKFKKGLVSGNMLMCKDKKNYVFSDISVIPNPDDKELSIITKSANEFAKLIGIKPKIALLSFSTNNSAEDDSVRKVRRAVNICKKMKLNVDGEMQVDTALIKSIAKSKMKKSKIAGEANVLIFPDLNSGNIGYKLVERLGEYKAIGPILSNLKKPVNVLSKGCSVEDIVDISAITSLQCQKS